MNWLRDMPIRRKVTLVILLTSTAALVHACVAFLRHELVTSRSGMVRDLSVLADVLGQNCTAALKFDDADAAKNILGAVQAKPHLVAAGLYTLEGQRFAEFVRPGTRAALPPQPGYDGYHFGPDRLTMFRPIRFGGKIIGTIYLRSDLGALAEHRRSFVKLAGMVLLVSVAFTIALSFWLQRLISRPILALANTAQIVREKKDYSVRAEGQGRSEIGLLTDSFNQMLTEIQTQDSALRQAHDELDQRVRERTAQLQEANKELEAFSYSVSHDLRAPLRSIDGFSQALLDECADKVSNEGKDYLRRIRTSSQRMGQLIDDLLNLSRLSRTELRRETVDLTALAKDVVAELQEREPQRRVELVIADGLKTAGDSQLLRVVLVNLLGNAWKFTSKQPKARIEFGYHRNNGTSAFYVRDNGAGFDMAYASKLFGAFQRLHATTEYSGTGIGLATVQRIIRRHGGRIWARAEVSEGATFEFTLGDTRDDH